jgi:hypothetical protein
MSRRKPTDAALLKQLTAVNDKLATQAAGKRRLELLRKQATLADERYERADTARRAAL